EQAAVQLAVSLRHSFEALVRLLEDPELIAAGGDDTTLRVTAAVRAGSGWQELEQVWAEGACHLEQVERTVIEVIAELEALPNASDVAKDIAAELNGQLDYWREVRRRLNTCLHEPGHGSVHWISGGGRLRAAWLNAAPIEVASLLRDR